jgi:hypothetical protein
LFEVLLHCLEQLGVSTELANQLPLQSSGTEFVARCLEDRDMTEQLALLRGEAVDG